MSASPTPETSSLEDRGKQSLRLSGGETSNALQSALFWARDRHSGSGRWSSARRISLQDFTVMLMLLDVAVIIAVGHLLNRLFFIFGPQTYSVPASEAPALITGSILYILAACAARTYSSGKLLDRRDALRGLLLALGGTFTLFVVFAAATEIARQHSRLWFFSWALVSALLVLANRFVMVALLCRSLQNRACVSASLSVGIFCDAFSDEEILQKTKGTTRVVRSMRLDDPRELALLSAEIGGAEIDQVYISTPWSKAPVVLRSLEGLKRLSVEIIVLPCDRHVEANVVRVGRLGQCLSLHAVERPIQQGWDSWLKRREDILVAVVALALFSPVMLLTALMIKLDSRGPILFRQKRIGFNGSIFEVLKFRSMHHRHADPGGSRQTSRGDSRVTRVGHFIRRTSIDELPQLFNVLQGTMSIVGPRPHALQTRAEGWDLIELVDDYQIRYRVKPGITGWAQVNGLRGELDRVDKLRRRVEYDIEYVYNWSIWLDIRIVLKTIRLMCSLDKNAY